MSSQWALPQVDPVGGSGGCPRALLCVCVWWSDWQVCCVVCVLYVVTSSLPGLELMLTMAPSLFDATSSVSSCPALSLSHTGHFSSHRAALGLFCAVPGGHPLGLLPDPPCPSLLPELLVQCGELLLHLL